MRSWIGMFLAMKGSVKPVKYSPIQKYLDTLGAAYKSTDYQAMMAIVIYVNFGVCVVAAQLNPLDGTSTANVIDMFNLVLTLIFTADLAINIVTTSSVSEFVANSWNWFDTVIVITSLISEFGPKSSTFKLFRLARVFRIMRLLRTIESLKKLVSALHAALPGVLNAFLIVLFVCCFFSIVAVSFFRERDPNYFGYFGIAMCPHTRSVTIV